MSSTHLRCLWVAAALSACGGHTLDVGSTDGGPGTGSPLTEAGTFGAGSPVWNGVLENAQLSNGSNRLTMTLSVAGDGTATGTLLLGDGTLLKPPTDPDVGYPPGAQFPMPAGPLGFFEGFAYSMLDGRLSGSRLTFRVAELELWKQWCTLQRPFLWWRDPDAGDEYSCAQNWGLRLGLTGCTLVNSNVEPPTELPIDCGKAALCQGDLPCNCSASGCRGTSLTQPDVSFDLTLAGDSADGTIAGGLGDHNVHFVRAP